MSERSSALLIPLLASLPLAGTGCVSSSGSSGDGDGSGDDVGDAAITTDVGDAGDSPETVDNDATVVDDIDQTDTSETVDTDLAETDDDIDDADAGDDIDAAEDDGLTDSDGDVGYDGYEAFTEDELRVMAAIETYCERYEDCDNEYFRQSFDSVDECADELLNYTLPYFEYSERISELCGETALEMLECQGELDLPPACGPHGDFDACIGARRATSIACGFLWMCDGTSDSVAPSVLCDGELDCPAGDDEYGCFD